MMGAVMLVEREERSYCFLFSLTIVVPSTFLNKKSLPLTVPVGREGRAGAAERVLSIPDSPE